MADVNVQVVRQPIDITTAPPSDDYTISGFGDPKGSLMTWAISVATDETRRNNLHIGMSFTDGTTTRSICLRSRDARTTSETARHISNDSMLTAIQQNNETMLGHHLFDSFITDGIRLNQTDDMPIAHPAQCALFNGADFECKVVETTVDCGSATTQTATSSLGFAPDGCIIMSGQTGSVSSATNASLAAKMITGFAVDDGGGIEQGGTTFLDRDAAGNGAPFVVSSDANIASNMANTSGAINTAIKVASFDSDTITFECTLGVGGQQQILQVFAFKTGGALSVSRQVARSTTGTQVVTTPGFKPQFLLALQTNSVATLGTSDGGADAGSFSLGMASAAGGTEREGCGAVTEEDGAATVQSSSWESPALVYVVSDDEVATTRATIQNHANGQFTSSGWDSEFTAVTGNASHIFYLAIEENIAGTRFPDRFQARQSNVRIPRPRIFA